MHSVQLHFLQTFAGSPGQLSVWIAFINYFKTMSSMNHVDLLLFLKPHHHGL